MLVAPLKRGTRRAQVLSAILFQFSLGIVHKAN
jgi:hypothetical protein